MGSVDRRVNLTRAPRSVRDVELDAEFVAFVHRRGDHHLRTAVLLTGDWHSAEDLVQSALVKLYRAWPRLDTSDDPDAYLRRILVNTQRSWWRARWRRETPVAAIPDLPGAGDPAEGMAVADVVRRALATLPVRQRTALVLRYFEDLPESKAAELMGCSVGSVKTHAHRGLRAMRDLLPDLRVISEAVNESPGQGREVQ